MIGDRLIATIRADYFTEAGGKFVKTDIVDRSTYNLADVKAMMRRMEIAAQEKNMRAEVYITNINCCGC